MQTMGNSGKSLKFLKKLNGIFLEMFSESNVECEVTQL